MSSARDNSRPQRQFRRFSLSQRLQHGVQILTFTTLCFTGLIQKFSSKETLEVLIQVLGGIEHIRVVHRGAAIIFVVEAIYHVFELGWLILVKRAPLTMLPKWKDARDAFQTLKYFLGATTERAQCDRFDFRQKVEYLSLIWGSIVMIATGLLMWFPAQASAVLPGEFIPAARVAHGGEGLLACLVIFTWHMYSAHLAPEVFPFDSTIFTGVISEERMIHEHPLEYARIMEAEAELETVVAPPSNAYEMQPAHKPYPTPPTPVYDSVPVPPLPEDPAVATRHEAQTRLAMQLPRPSGTPALNANTSPPSETFSQDEWYEALRRVTHASNVAAENPVPVEEEPLELEDIDYIDDTPTGQFHYAPKQSQP